jgi:hypothetical protein
MTTAGNEKAPYGGPCNGCGLCCRAARCILAQHVFKLDEFGPCPVLTKTGDRTYGCGLALAPGKFVPELARAKGSAALRKAALLLIAAGEGCDTWLPGEPSNPTFEKALFDSTHNPKTIKAARRAKRVWGQLKIAKAGESAS